MIAYNLPAQSVYNKLYKPDSIVIAGIASFPDTRHIIGYYVTMDNISSFCVGDFDEWGEVNNLYSILPYSGFHFITWGWSVLKQEDNILFVINRENFSNSLVDYDILSKSYEVIDYSYTNGLMVLNSIIPTSDGGYAMSGNGNLIVQNNGDMLLYKINAALEVEWYHNYGGPEIGRAFTLAEIPPRIWRGLFARWL